MTVSGSYATLADHYLQESFMPLSLPVLCLFGHNKAEGEYGDKVKELGLDFPMALTNLQSINVLP